MAESLDDGVFWLPPRFLTDDDVVAGKNGKGNEFDGFGLERDCNKSLFPLEFPYAFGPSPDLGSPVESVVGSTETESDDEDYLPGLTRQMALATLEEDFKRNNFTFGTENTKDRVVFGSPQSTLCAIGSGCDCGQGLSRGSPRDASRAPSPPAAWDLLYAAAGEVARMQMKGEVYGSNHGIGVLGPPRKPSAVSIPFKHSDLEEYFAHKKLQAYRFQQLKQQQLLMQQSSQLWGKGNAQYRAPAFPVFHNGARSSSRGPLNLSQSAWPPIEQALQQVRQGRSDTRSAFIASNVIKRECAGTGVFLPRQAGTRPETRTKPACSPVVVPDRLPYSLNCQSRFTGGFDTDGDASAATRVRSNYNSLSQQKRNIRPHSGMNHEIRLPQEWSY